MRLSKAEKAARNKEASKAPIPITVPEPGTALWCKQTMFLLNLYWQGKVMSDRACLKIFVDLKEYEVWKRIPPENPYGTLDALLKAEVGVDADGIKGKPIKLSKAEKSKRNKEIFKAPRGLPGAEPGTLSWCYQTVSLLEIYWQSKVVSEGRWLKLLGELKDYEVWNKYPPEKPYGTLEALLKAELECLKINTPDYPMPFDEAPHGDGLLEVANGEAWPENERPAGGATQRAKVRGEEYGH